MYVCVGGLGGACIWHEVEASTMKSQGLLKPFHQFVCVVCATP